MTFTGKALLSHFATNSIDVDTRIVCNVNNLFTYCHDGDRLAQWTKSSWVNLNLSIAAPQRNS